MKLLVNKVKNIVWKLSFIVSYLVVTCCNSYAQIYGQGRLSNQPTWGDSANQLSSTLFDISNLWISVSMIAGLGFLFVAIVKYTEYRKNPQQTPLGYVFLLLFIAFWLIGIYVFIQYGDSIYLMLEEKFGR